MITGDVKMMNRFTFLTQFSKGKLSPLGKLQALEYEPPRVKRLVLISRNSGNIASGALNLSFKISGDRARRSDKNSLVPARMREARCFHGINFHILKLALVFL